MKRYIDLRESSESNDGIYLIHLVPNGFTWPWMKNGARGLENGHGPLFFFGPPAKKKKKKKEKEKAPQGL